MIDHKEFYECFSWLFFYLITYHLTRKVYLKETNIEPIITGGGSRYNFRTGTKETLSDFIFTMIVLIIPSVATYLFYLLIK